VSGERVGTPAVGIMTSAFVDGAELMASALGVRGYAFAVIGHPISSASDAELETKARDALAHDVAHGDRRAPCGALGDLARRGVGTVVDHHDLERARVGVLREQRSEGHAQVVRARTGGDDHGGLEHRGVRQQ